MTSDFHITRTTISLEILAEQADTYEEFCKYCSDDFIDSDAKVGIYLQELLYKYDKKASRVSEDAGLATAYVGNIINGKKNNPSRDTLICICIAIGASFDETQTLLKFCGHQSLYVRRKRDVIIWFGLKKGQSLEEVDDTLINNGLKGLLKY